MEKLKHIIKSQQFSRELLDYLFDETELLESELSTKNIDILKGKILSTIFYEPSTRTRLSFESAMLRLGGSVISTENAREFSSAAKGETLEDTIKVMQAYSDVIVLRHYESGAATIASKSSNVPIINAGDGPGQHPTQALIDLYTIRKELNKIDELKIAMVGDLANGRTVRSLCYLLSKYNNIKLYFVSPDVVRMNKDILDYLLSHNIEFFEEKDLKKVASIVDVIYQTRIQKERFGDNLNLYNEAKGKYIIDTNILSVMKEKSIILHPLPRLDEIKIDVDNDPRAAYFRQAQNGLYIRASLLKYILI